MLNQNSTAAATWTRASVADCTPENESERTVTSGGRVLCATALGTTVGDAQARAYALARQVTWDGVYYRNDIGYRAVARERQGA